MPYRKNIKPELSDPNYVPVIRNSETFYGGSQMWFPSEHRFSRDYILHSYGCGTIATADLFLYLALQDKRLRSLETEIAFRGSTRIYSENYEAYVRNINSNYTKTKRYLAVIGTRIASSINNYCDSYGFGYRASWKFRLTYYDMLEMMEEMLYQDIPVILSIGPNTPRFWRHMGVVFYTIREIIYPEIDTNHIKEEPSSVKESSGQLQQPAVKSPVIRKAYYYQPVTTPVQGHYVMVTGILRDDIANRIMLRISSWGKQYYINYEEYRDYITSFGDTFTSSMVRISKTTK